MLKTVKTSSAALALVMGLFAAPLAASGTVSSDDAAAALAAQAMALIAPQPLETAPGAEEDVSPPGPEVAEIRPRARKASYASPDQARLAQFRPVGRPYEYVLPHTRWEHKKGNKRWTKAAMAAVLSHGKRLTDTVPSDYKTWCPGYKENDEFRRAMFWVGFMSALAKHESTYRQDAVGGGGLWYGLLQILPSTARLYKCEARTGAALKDGALNLSCATRIMSKTVGRDKIIHGFFPGTRHKYRGVTQDWGPMHSDVKRREMAAWTRKQAYCQSRMTLRPKARPEATLIEASAAEGDGLTDQ